MKGKLFLQTTPELGSWENELNMHCLHEQIESGSNQTINFEQKHLIFNILHIHALEFQESNHNGLKNTKLAHQIYV